MRGRWTNELDIENRSDSAGTPTGGLVRGPGLCIEWQCGPLGRGAEKKAANGAFVEDVLLAAVERLRYYNESKFKCRENSLAITKIEEAMFWLDARHDNREARGVQGEHKV